MGYSPWGGKESAMTERLTLFTFTKALYWASLVAQTVKRLPEMWETRVRFLGREDALEKEMAIHSNTLAWKIPWTEEPDRLVHGVAKSRTRLSDFTFTFFHFHT